MTRRALVLAAFTTRVVAERREAPEILEVLGRMAEALSAANAPAFLDEFDADFPQIHDLRVQIQALVEQWDIATSIEPLRGSTENGQRVVELDWFLELRAKPPSNAIVRRRQTVTARLAPKRRNWKVVELAPLSLFAAIVPEVHGSSPR